MRQLVGSIVDRTPAVVRHHQPHEVTDIHDEALHDVLARPGLHAADLIGRSETIAQRHSLGGQFSDIHGVADSLLP
ncbi:hypothetical protein [Horticoccus sp. 23ND18S-11]|uniref:hypothetical protein n=1 Tax=Horticoccus sp. 23ND18S-11 TaxID=3391832 RepID=UPI0039C92752